MPAFTAVEMMPVCITESLQYPLAMVIRWGLSIDTPNVDIAFMIKVSDNVNVHPPCPLWYWLLTDGSEKWYWFHHETGVYHDAIPDILLEWVDSVKGACLEAIEEYMTKTL